MSSHGCIRCAMCGGSCPLCGTCGCKRERSEQQMCWCGNGLVGTFHSCGMTHPPDSGYWKRLPSTEELFNGFVEGEHEDDAGQGNDDGV